MSTTRLVNDATDLPQRWYATGRRKEATARVWLSEGTGKMIVNGQEIQDYLCRAVLANVVKEPLEITESLESFDVMATVRGGGLAGQAGALRHGISRALSIANPENRPSLKTAGLLTRDARAKERKKYGQRGARARFQFSKR